MNVIAAIIAFILGTAIGSFLSVVIYRIHKKKKGIFLSHSVCPECNKKIKWRHLIPLFSWLFLRGKCGYCGKPISSHYFVMELATGLLFLGAFLEWNFVNTIPSTIDPNLLHYTIDWDVFQILIFYLIEFTLLVAIFFYDLMYKVIPDRFSIPTIIIGIAGGLLFGIPTPLNMLIGATAFALFFILQFVISKGAWIGGGDVRLGLIIGVLLGFEKGLVALILAYLIGAVLSLILLIQKKVNRKTAIPFGPFLITGVIVAIFWGEYILDWYLGTMLF